MRTRRKKEPDMVDKFTGGKDSKLDENDVKDILDSADVQ